MDRHPSRQHRDRVNAAVMADARMLELMALPMPFDMKQTSYGGFDVVVDAPAPRRARPARKSPRSRR
ncbi:MAG TPA: hypothetical protein VFZ65_14155 [Planctomycetota bacterium]|nr:hypothetical protein [Planctomycetota bacterium]